MTALRKPMEWVTVVPVDSNATFRTYRGPLPPERRYVLLQVARTEPRPVSLPGSLDGVLSSQSGPSVHVGWLKFSAGDQDCPFFVIPSGPDDFEVTHWCDCLGDDFHAPLWPERQR